MTLRLYLFAVIILFLAPKTDAQNKDSGNLVIKMLKDFYTSYVTEDSKMPLDLKKIESIKERFCTPYLLTELRKKELDYDPFLNAQDCGVELLKTLKIQKDLKKVRFYNVSYMDNFTKKPIIIRLSIVKVGGLYKINAIQ